MTERVGDLEIAQDLAFQRAEWRVQRIAWAVLALLLLAGFAGLFGNGPLAHAEAQTDGLSVAYDRIVRKRAPVELRVLLPPAGPDGAEVWLSRSLTDAFDVEAIVPEPASQRAAGDRVVFPVGAADPGGPFEVVFALEAADPGGFAGEVGVVGGPRVAVSGFVLP